MLGKCEQASEAACGASVSRLACRVSVSRLEKQHVGRA